MNLSLCTISFRHQLASLEEIVSWASKRPFSGIELWGVHAKNLQQSAYGVDWLYSHGLRVPMVSDYFPLRGEEPVALDKARELCRVARRWEAPKVRTFAGDRGSSDVSSLTRAEWVGRLRRLCELVDSFGLTLLVETHPNTLADTTQSTLQLLEEVNHPALRLNYDVIHVWESGADPLEFIREVASVVDHVHLKNIASREDLPVFEPLNVYSPAGRRAGMVSLFDGAFDYREFLSRLMNEPGLVWGELDASLEWFGPDVLATLERDAAEVRRVGAESVMPTTGVPGQVAS